MTRVVIIGELYNAGLEVGGGPIYPGGPVDPGWGHTPGHPGNRPPGSSPGYPSGGPVYPGGPTDPGYGRPGWGGPTDPGWGHTPGYPSGQPIVPPQGGTDVPADEYQPLPPPEDIYSQYVVSVWNPKTASWTTKSYPPPQG
jgi:hypothetical protein